MDLLKFLLEAYILVSVRCESENSLEKLVEVAVAEEGSGTDVEDIEEFIPSYDWQKVKPGQVLPPGLHVRLNMKTGEKEAKIIEADDNTQLSLPLDRNIEEESEYENEQQRHRVLTKAMEDIFKDLQTSADSMKCERKKIEEQLYEHWKTKDHAPQRGNAYTMEELQEALSRFKEGQDPGDGMPQEDSEKNVRSMEEIKEDFYKYNMNIKTDSEILRQLLKTYTEDLSDDHRLVILEDFEFYVHQVDNAIEFIDLGGFLTLAKGLNSSNEDVRSATALVFGSAAQSNPAVQIRTIELNVMQRLIYMLSHEASMPVRLRALYALSSCIRHFPYAQERFMQFGGLQVLHSIFSEEGAEKLKLKSVTLISDLAEEQLSTLNHMVQSDDSHHEERKKQYKMVPLFAHIQEQGWCNDIPSLLQSTSHDYREKTLHAMSNLLETCRDTFVQSLETLLHLDKEYTILSDEESLDEEHGFYKQMLNIVRDLQSSLTLKSKDEL